MGSLLGGAVMAVGAAALVHTAWAVQKYGLFDALQKSLARKGSFTKPLDPVRDPPSPANFPAPK